MASKHPSISTYCCCPGWCYTDLSRHSGLTLVRKLLFAPFAFMFMRSSARGSENILHVATEAKDALVSGGFYRDCKVALPETKKIKELSEKTGKELWAFSEKLVGETY